jgi:hypothetical protein
MAKFGQQSVFLGFKQRKVVIASSCDETIHNSNIVCATYFGCKHLDF